MTEQAFTLAQSAPAAPSAPPPTSDAYVVASIVLGGVGVLFLALELLIPTSGMLALLCGTCFIASVVSMFMWSTTAGLILLFSYTIAAPFVFLLLLKLWSKSPIVRRYTLNESSARVVTADTGVDGLDPDLEGGASELARFRRQQSMAKAIGTTGVTETPLRPAGFVMIDGQRVDAIAESGYIERGTAVRVVAVVDGALKVRAES